MGRGRVQEEFSAGLSTCRLCFSWTCCEHTSPAPPPYCDTGGRGSMSKMPARVSLLRGFGAFIFLGVSQLGRGLGPHDGLGFPVCLKGDQPGPAGGPGRRLLSHQADLQANSPESLPPPRLASRRLVILSRWPGGGLRPLFPSCLPGLGAAAAWSLPAAPRLCNGDESSAAGWPRAPGGAASACRCRRGDGTCPNRRRRGSLSAHHFRGHRDWQGRPALIGLPRAGLSGRGPDTSRPSARRRR